MSKRLTLLGTETALARSVALRLGWTVETGERPQGCFLVCESDPGRRRELFLAAVQAGGEAVTLVDPSACVHPSVQLGAGCLILPRVVVNGDTCLGANCIVGLGSSLDHDNRLGDHVRIGSLTHLAGTVTVGEGSWLGAGVSVIPGRSIGAEARVECGSVVVRDVPPGGRVSGVPAR